MYPVMMEVHSEPDFTEETVTDLDLGFSTGLVKQLTLYKDDSYSISPDEIQVNFAAGEDLTVNRAHVAWFSERQRVVRTPVKKSPTAKGNTPAPASLAHHPV